MEKATIEERYLHFLKDLEMKLVLYDVVKKEWSSETLLPKIPPLQYFNSILYKDDLYIFGGEQSNSKSDFTYLYNISSKKVEKKANMPIKKNAHNSILINTYIYSAGGRIKTPTYDTATNSCEKYSIIKDIWTCLPPLNHPREGISLICLKDRILYGFGGVAIGVYSGEGYLEYMDILEESQGWTAINPKSPDKSWRRCESMISFQTSDDEIIICGGWDRNNDCKLFSHSKKCVIAMKNALPMQAAFYNRNVFAKKGKALCPVYDHFCIFAFTLAKKQFEKELIAWEKEAHNIKGYLKGGG